MSTTNGPTDDAGLPNLSLQNRDGPGRFPTLFGGPVPGRRRVIGEQMKSWGFGVVRSGFFLQVVGIMEMKGSFVCEGKEGLEWSTSVVKGDCCDGANCDCLSRS